MQCPFPGMDPYLERPAIWPDFHDSLIAYIREALQQHLRPRYVALTQDRLFVVEHDRPIQPDVSIIETGSPQSGSVRTAVADAPLVVEMFREEVRQPYLQIIEPAAGNQVVTAIEVLSPDNKRPGAGRTSYLNKQDELWMAQTNLVEIDLLRGGAPVPRIPEHRLDDLPSRRYLVSVTRNFPTRCELYGFALQQPIPKISVPLASDDKDIALDLQQVFQRCWSTGPYPELLQYDQTPPGELSDEELDFCRRRVTSS